MAVKADLFGLQTQGRELRHRAIACLGADPDLALALAPIDRAVHRLEGRVGEKWLVIDRVHVGRRARRRLLEFALAGGQRPGLMSGGFQLRHDVRLLYGRVRSLVPARRQRLHALHGRPGVVRHHRDHITLVHHLSHTADGEGRIGCEPGDRPALDGRERDERRLRVRWPCVDAEHRAAVHLLRRVTPWGGATDEPELLRGLQRWRRRHRQGRGGGGQLPVAQASAGRSVDHFAALRVAGVDGHTPALRRRLDQHQARGRTRLPQRRPALDDGQGGAGRLVSLDALGGSRVDCETIDGGIGRGGLHDDRAKIDLQLLGDQHRQ